MIFEAYTRIPYTLSIKLRTNSSSYKYFNLIICDVWGLNINLAPVKFIYYIALLANWLAAWIVILEVQSSNPGTED